MTVVDTDGTDAGGQPDEGDGFPDCSDFSCRGVQENRTFNRDGEAINLLVSPCSESFTGVDAEMDRNRAIALAINRCNNGIDEDGDGFTDCEDWDCHWDPIINPHAQNATGPLSSAGFCQGWLFNGTTWVPNTAPNAPPAVPLLCN